ncbi:MAG TPA: LamG domain-containing protein, partial [Rubricoccaceae bacterium]|nr:LamG domain-containing protein [Rubricoccaceae bacterium]
DFGPNGYHGTAEGATLTPDWRGRPNRAYAFDGDDRVALGDVLNEIRVPFTVATWVRFTEDSVGSLFHSDLYPRTEPDSMYYGVGLQITHWDLRVHYTSGGPIGPQSRRSKYSSPVGLHDRWVHVIGVVRGPQDMSLYMNGRDIGGYYSGSGGPLRHNFWQAVIGDRFRGSMDDVMIFDRALSAHEVALLYRLMHADQA